MYTGTTHGNLLVSEWHVDVFFCAHCCHDVLPFVIKLVVAVLSISHQFRCGLMLERNAYTIKKQHILNHWQSFIYSIICTYSSILYCFTTK